MHALRINYWPFMHTNTAYYAIQRLLGKLDDLASTTAWHHGYKIGGVRVTPDLAACYHFICSRMNSDADFEILMVLLLLH